jgi:NADPH:quinone reductase-like Zn-dependent oxidoreductase
MRAVQADRFGGPEVLKIVEVGCGEPPAGHLLVEVAAAGVGPWDAAVLRGAFGRPRLPFTPGADLAGTVLRTGPDVGDFAPGDPVWAYPTLTGAWRQLAIVPATKAAHRPVTVGAEEAGGMPVAAVTALEGLLDVLDLREGETLLVTGAAGAVGSLVVQLAPALRRDVRVLALTAARNLAWVAELGVAAVFDSAGAWPERVRELAPAGVDAVFDVVGGPLRDQASLVARDGARIATTVPCRDARLRPGVRCRFYAAQGTRARLETMAGMVDSGTVMPTTTAVYKLDEVRDALGALAQPHRGKIVLSLI